MTLPRQDLALSPVSHCVVDRGHYFTASNPVPGTGLATIAALTAEVDTSPYIAFNTGVMSVYIDYIRITVTAPGTGGSQLRYSARTDKLKTAPTGGTTITPACALRPGAATGLTPPAPPASQSSWYAGPLVAAAAQAALRHFSSPIRPVLPVINDTYLIKFGASDYGVSSLVPNGTLNADRYIPEPAWIIGPNMTGQIHLWLPSQTVASSYEFEVGFWEDP